MKRSKSPSRHTQASVEPLEARIAPAGLIFKTYADIGKLGDDKDIDYRDGPNLPTHTPGFVNMETSNDAISNALGHLPDTYYMKLTKGQSIRVYNGSAGLVPNYAVVTSGTVLAFFHDANDDGEFEIGELDGFSISDGAGLIFKDALQGDIVENLNKDGSAITKTALSTGAGVKNLTFLSGDVTGKLLVGSNLLKGSFKGIGDIFAGTAAGGQTYDFFPDIAGVTGTVDTFTPGAGVKGISITNLNIEGIGAVQALPFIINHPVGTIQAGDGGPGAAGGSISKITVLQDGDGFNLFAGNGGASSASAHKLNGGAGGALSAIYVAGINDVDTPGHPTQNSQITMTAGDGGLGDTGLGGKGGAASNVWVGFRKLGTGLPQPTSNFLHDNVSLMAGDGGNGKTAGAGGALSIIRFNLNTTGDATLGNDEILVKAGLGGSTAGATKIKAGLGGAIKDVIINNLVQQDLVDPSGPIGQLTFLPNANIRIDAGDAGQANGGAGANGGAVTTVKLLGSNIFVNAGDGSSGTKGGIGGTVAGLTIRQEGNIFARTGEVNAGIGGDSSATNGAAGGNVTNFVIEDSDLGRTGTNPGTVFAINTGNAANGGDGAKGVGGRGGAVTGLQIFERDTREGQAPSTRLAGKIDIRTGIGGDGLKAGAPGGVFDNTTIATVGADIGITVGHGGNGLATGKANGGLGGHIVRLDISAGGNTVPNPLNVTQVIELPVSVSVVSGSGGNGGTLAGNVSRGGAGGAVTKANINSSGAASLTAGDGGNGGGGAAGVGASISVSGVFARGGDASLIAGDAGAVGLKPAVGGSVMGSDNVNLAGVFGTANVTLKAGDGSHGGAGGKLNFIGYGAASQALLPTPTGNITITSGNGSAEGKIAGAGGAIANISGSVSSGFGSLTSITAGKGGGSPLASSAGGSIINLLIQRGPLDVVDSHTGVINPAGSLTIQAGDAGNAGLAAGAVTAGKAAAGGSVSQVTVLDIGQGTTFRSIVAGDGATGPTVGGAGGSVTEIHVLGHDIGQKTGQPFGVGAMGGIFAGVSGHGTTEGKAGSVVGITADSISAIAAGKAASPDLAERVERITLNAGEVLPPALSTSASAQFQLTYHPVLDYDVLLSDAQGHPQQQEFTRLLGGSNHPVNQQPGGGPTTFILTYGSGITQITTAPIDADASAATIKQALNDAGLTTVSVTATATTFEIDFTSANNNGPITGIGTEKTQALAGNTVPAKVRAALNQLPNIDDRIANNSQFDGVDVITTPTNNYQITFRNQGDAADITAERLHAGVTTVTTIGDSSHAETQNVDVIGVGTFTLTYGSTTTPRLPVGATPQQVEDALNLLPGITFDGDVTVTQGIDGSYDVQFNSPGAVTNVVRATEYSDITTATSRVGAFNTVELVAPDATHAEQQGFTPVGAYRLSYQGVVSNVVLPSNATATDVKTALNNISTIQNRVTDVTGTFQSGFVITFQGGTNFDPISILQSEQQTVNLPLLRYANDNGLVFHVTETVNGVPVVSEVSLPGDATAAEVQAALNGLPVIASHNGVTVKLAADNTYTISFKTPVDAANITIDAVDHLPTTSSEIVQGANSLPAPITPVQDGDNNALVEIQQYTPPTVGTYTLTLRASSAVPIDATNTTAPIAADATPDQVRAILLGVPSVAAAGGVGTVVLSNGSYVINFSNTADQPTFEISYQAQEIQRVDVDSLGNFTLTSADAAFTAAEAVPGNAATQEVQTFTPENTVTPFTLTFRGQTTAVVPENATALQVQDALNKIQTIAEAGGVAVTGTAANGYTVTFGDQADQPNLTGRNVTHLLSPSATAADVQAELNLLLGANSVQSVTGGPNGVFDVTFTSLADQAPIVADETLALNPLTSAAGSVKLQVPRLTTFTEQDYRASHIVGAIADFNELGADIFKYIDTNHDGKFTLGDGSGDLPVDGLIAAKIFNQNAPTNFTPQARFVLNVVDPNGKVVPVAPKFPGDPNPPFFDFHNVI